MNAGTTRRLAALEGRAREQQRRREAAACEALLSTMAPEHVALVRAASGPALRALNPFTLPRCPTVTLSPHRGLDRRLYLLPHLLSTWIQAFIDLLPQLRPNRLQGLIHLVQEVPPHRLERQGDLLLQLLTDGLQRLVDLLLQTFPDRLEDQAHLLEHGIRDLALHLLEDGVDSLSDLVLEHLTQVHLGAEPLPIVRRTPLVPSRRLVIPSLTALLGALSMR